MTTSEEAAAPLLRARGVRVELPGARSRVLRRRAGSSRALVGLDLQVLAGDTIWIVGAGHDVADAVGGVLCGELAPTSGTVELAGRDLSALRGRARARARRQLARLGPEAGATLDPRRTAAEIIADAAAGSARSVTPEHVSRSRDLLGQLGLGADSCEARTSALSQDDRILVAAARVIALEPRLVVYHPVWQSRPDGGTVWEALTGLREQADTALVVVTEGLPGSLRPGERALVLCGGRVVEVLGHGDLEHPLHPYSMTLQEGSSGPRHAVAPESGSRSSARTSDEGCPFRSDCPRAKARCASEVPRLDRPLGATHDVACHFPEDPRRPRAPDARQVGGQVGAAGPGAVPPAQSDEPTAREFAEG